MSQNLKGQFPPQTKIEVSDICGFWEVASISNKKEIENPPSITNRIKYHLLKSGVYVRTEDGIPAHGTWMLSKKVEDDVIQYSIILSRTIKYRIISLSFDELRLADRSADYLLVRKL